MTDVDPASVWPEDADDVDEAVVANWFVRDGASVEEGETVAEIQIEKVSVDVPAPASGTIARLVEESGEFRRGDAIARID
ncbi:lipoyl domain-containing protein [Halobacterium litoreum]|uniref:Lipoyl domain-containing protein n=1 Tax=Halobacterium litoreum TaxID=2039234 RepID=A0ABD5NDK3_9EURY|nr:lipoyl domain-containing protein [Halobacterium litoreum]UHH13792.1 lipoyl domain-containing protein [Halobacterium litoreum]